jgi:hypothetical protein
MAPAIHRRDTNVPLDSTWQSGSPRFRFIVLDRAEYRENLAE